MTLIKGKHTLTNIDKVTNVIFSQVRFNIVPLTNTVGHVAPDSRVISRCRCMLKFVNLSLRHLTSYMWKDAVLVSRANKTFESK